jgi:cytoskeleton protein RodZ
MGETLGQYFRRGREQKGWTLEKAASKTRILPQYLQAVENDNYEQLPAEVFAKGFIRSYAQTLGLNETEVLAKFNESGGQFYALRDEREQLQQRALEEARRKKANKLIVAGMVGLALIVLLLATGQDRDRASGPAETLREPPPPPTMAPQASQPIRPEPSARVEAPTVLPENPPIEVPSVPMEIERNFSSGLPLEGILPQGSKLVLEVEAIERAWVLVQADHDPAQDVLLSPGERVRWSADQRLRVTLGNAGGVRISVNGKPQGPYGTSGKVIKNLIFTR